MLRIFIWVAVMAISCKHSHSESDSPAYKEVMAIHDAVMPEITNIHKLKKELKALEIPEANEVILDQIKNLNDADEAMMLWMEAFKVPEDKASEEAYLASEKIKIQAVSDQMFLYMKRASSVIDSLKSIQTVK